MSTRGWPSVILLSFLLLTGGCTGSHAAPVGDTVSPSSGGGTYHDPAGWSIQVPEGWHVTRFDSSKAGASAGGAQVSNVKLPPPSVVPGFPIQTNDRVLPSDGIALIIATDDDPKVSQRPTTSPPLTYPDGWTRGSALAGAPTLDTLWFTGNGKPFVATVKTGAKASSAVIKTLAGIVGSLQFEHTQP